MERGVWVSEGRPRLRINSEEKTGAGLQLDPSCFLRLGDRIFQEEEPELGVFFLLLPGQPLPEEVSAVGRLLYLGQAQSAHEGTYTCECSNEAGVSSQEQRLEVHGEPGVGGAGWAIAYLLHTFAPKSKSREVRHTQLLLSDQGV